MIVGHLHICFETILTLCLSSFFFKQRDEHYYDDIFAAASRLEVGVPFYLISDYRFAVKFRRFIGRGRTLITANIVFVNKENFTLYGTHTHTHISSPEFSSIISLACILYLRGMY
jgi:hypothetical protein